MRMPAQPAGGTHIEARELPGVKCLRMEPSRSTAMIDVFVRGVCVSVVCDGTEEIKMGQPSGKPEERVVKGG